MGTLMEEASKKKSLDEMLAEIAARIPREELAKLPSDLGDRLDYYIYGISEHTERSGSKPDSVSSQEGGRGAMAEGNLAERLSAYAAGLRYEDLTSEAVHEAKRRLLDTLGCAMGSFESEPATIARKLAATVQSDFPA